MQDLAFDPVVPWCEYCFLYHSWFAECSLKLNDQWKKYSNRGLKGEKQERTLSTTSQFHKHHLSKEYRRYFDEHLQFQRKSEVVSLKELISFEHSLKFCKLSIWVSWFAIVVRQEIGVSHSAVIFGSRISWQTAIAYLSGYAKCQPIKMLTISQFCLSFLFVYLIAYIIIYPSWSWPLNEAVNTPMHFKLSDNSFNNCKSYNASCMYLCFWALLPGCTCYF